MDAIEQRDAELAARHDYPNDKFGSGYAIFTRFGSSEELDAVYVAAWNFLASGVL